MRAPTLDRVVGCRKRLPKHLPTENLCTTDIAALPAVEVVLDALELQELDQITQNSVHSLRMLRNSRFTAIDDDTCATNENRFI